MPLTTIYDGGTRIIGDATALEESLHPATMAYVNIMRQSSGGNYIMSVSEIDAVNNMVKAMVANGIWSKMLAVYPIIGGTAAGHKYNLVDPRDVNAAYRLTFTAGWTHSATGMTPNGAASADTFLAPSAIGTSHHISFYSRTQNSQNAVEMGAQNGGGVQQVSISFYYPGVNNKNFTSGGYPTYAAIATASTGTTGLIIGSRTANNDSRLFYNGYQLAQNTNSTTSFSTGTFRIGSNANLLEFSTKQCAFVSIGTGLTPAEAKQLSAIVQVFQTKLGRQV